MSSCGLKNSACAPGVAPNTYPSAIPSHLTLDENNGSKRFVFVDLIDGLWSTSRSNIYASNPVIECPLGGSVVFHYPSGRHDVVAMFDQKHYDNCDFGNSTQLAPFIQNDQFESVTYYHKCTTPGQIDYISCSVSRHCQQFGQKVMVRTSSSINTHDEVSGEWLIHVQSLNRVLRLLGQRSDPSTGFLIFDRGYQTEELANQTMEWIWCGLDHCPSFADTWKDATNADCEGAINTLMGFVSRKRPLPVWDVAEKYYQKAIQVGGRNECAARSYISKLFLDKHDFDNATLQADKLCQACGTGDPNDPGGVAVRQAKYEFDSLSPGSRVQWPASGACSNKATDAASIARTRSADSHLLLSQPFLTMIFSIILIWYGKTN